MKAYKLVRKSRDGKLYPLFIDRKRPYVIGGEADSRVCTDQGVRAQEGFPLLFHTLCTAFEDRAQER